MTELSLKELDLLTKAVSITKKYTLPLVIRHGPKPLDIIGGSGTLVIMAGHKGILTNEHVAAIFREKMYCHTAPGTNDIKMREIHFSGIISLPEQQPEKRNDVDMAFMLLNKSSITIIESMGKNFWDLDQEAIKYDRQKGFEYQGRAIWLIHANVLEGLKWRNNVYDATKNAAPYVVVPSLGEIEHSSCCYQELNFTFSIDNVICPINTKEKTPHCYDGMSGGALWKACFDQQDEIKHIHLFGIATQPQKNEQTKEVQALVCRGPKTLYESFYPYVLFMLMKLSKNPKNQQLSSEKASNAAYNLFNVGL